MPVHYRLEGATGIIEIARPERRNALNLESLEALAAGLVRARTDRVRCLVVTGSDGHFCTGADLKELEDTTFTDRLGVVLDELITFEQPTIAAISGACMGLGMQLALSCDLRVATDDASFGVPVAKLGLMVNHQTLERLVSVFGFGAARHLLLAAEVLPAADAYRLGFIQQIGPLADALELARRIDSLAPLSLAGTKLGLNLLEPRPDAEEYLEAFRRAWASADLREGRAAFAERRTPVFTGE